MQRFAKEHAPASSIREVAFASFIGTTIEWYDFFIYGTSAALVFPRLGGALYGIAGVFMAELFPARLRYSGISLGYQLAGLLGGALAPFIATALVEWAEGASWPVALYVTLTGIVTLMAIYFASERHRVDIHDLQITERQFVRG